MKFAHLTKFKPDFDNRTMVETTEPGVAGQYVPAQTVSDLIAEHEQEMKDAEDGRKREISLLEAQIAELKSNRF